MTIGRPSGRGVSWAAANHVIETPADRPLLNDAATALPLSEVVADDESSSSSSNAGSLPSLVQRCDNSSDDDSSTDSMPRSLDNNDVSMDASTDSLPQLLPRPSNRDSPSDDESSTGSMPPLAPTTRDDNDLSFDCHAPAYQSRMLSYYQAEFICQACSADVMAHEGRTDNVDVAMNAILQRAEVELDLRHHSMLRNWLTDSGASSHVTPHVEDLILNVEESNAVVQVANGALIRAELRGTARIRIQDLNDPRITCDILAHDVLHVPGLSRRLLSVDQWNAAGGEIWFHPEHTALRAVDSESGEAHSFSVAKPFTLLRNVDGLPSASSHN
jgi:hypothetical protein